MRNFCNIYNLVSQTPLVFDWHVLLSVSGDPEAGAAGSSQVPSGSVAERCVNQALNTGTGTSELIGERSKAEATLDARQGNKVSGDEGGWLESLMTLDRIIPERIRKA